MKRTEFVYRHILQEAESNRKKLTQAGIARALGVSLSTVNHALRPLRKMGAVSVGLRNFSVVDTKKILMLWASIRNIEKDVIYATRAEMAARDIEKTMPSTVVFAAYSAYRLAFKETPADYSEVYVYGDGEEVKKRFPPKAGPPNVFVLEKHFDKMTKTQMFVDLWNLREWYAKDYLNALERRLDAILA